MTVRWTRPHKYGARPVEIDGIRFASTREGERYQQLKLLACAGDLWDLVLQPAFVLCVVPHDVDGNSTPVPIGRYKADFSYQTRDGRVIEDVKGVRTPLFVWKKRHAELQFGIRIVEL